MLKRWGEGELKSICYLLFAEPGLLNPMDRLTKFPGDLVQLLQGIQIHLAEKPRHGRLGSQGILF